MQTWRAMALQKSWLSRLKSRTRPGVSTSIAAAVAVASVPILQSKHCWNQSPLIWHRLLIFGYGSIPINTIFSGMNIHLPAILGFTRYQGFDPLPFIDTIFGQLWTVSVWGTWHIQLDVTPDQTATWAAAFVAVIPVPQRPRPLRARRVLAMTVGDPDWVFFSRGKHVKHW